MEMLWRRASPPSICLIKMNKHWLQKKLQIPFQLQNASSLCFPRANIEQYSGGTGQKILFLSPLSPKSRALVERKGSFGRGVLKRRRTSSTHGLLGQKWNRTRSRSPQEKNRKNKGEKSGERERKREVGEGDQVPSPCLVTVQCISHIGNNEQ